MTNELRTLYEMACKLYMYDNEEEFLNDIKEDAITVTCDDFDLLVPNAEMVDDDNNTLVIYGVQVMCDPYEDWDAEEV